MTTSTEPTATEDETTAALLGTARRVRAGELPPASLERPLRSATMVVELDSRSAAAGQHEVVWTQTPQALLPVFTDVEQLAGYCLRRGDDGDVPVSYGQLTGADLLDSLLGQLPAGLGLVLDPAAEYALIIPTAATGGDPRG